MISVERLFGKKKLTVSNDSETNINMLLKKKTTKNDTPITPAKAYQYSFAV